jgi:hypothetical protein
MDAILSKPSPDALKTAINECLVPAIQVINNTLQNGLQAIDQKSSQRLNQLESNIVRVVLPSGSSHGVDPLFAAAEPLSRAMPGIHWATTDVSSRKRAPVPLKPLQPAQNGTLVKGGGPRKKRKAVREAVRLNAEEPTDYPRPSLVNSDSHCRTLADFWKIYKKWELEEMKCGCKWRRDEPLVVEDGGTETSGGRSQWWSRRKGMFDTVLFYKNKFKEENPEMTDEAVEEKAVEEAEKIFDTVPVACSGHRRLGDINDVFRRALQSLGQPSRRGRPRKNLSGRGRPRKNPSRSHEKNGRNNQTADPFGSAFSELQIEDATLNMNKDDDVDD